jgi:hypothetical protein
MAMSFGDSILQIAEDTLWVSGAVTGAHQSIARVKRQAGMSSTSRTST